MPKPIDQKAGADLDLTLPFYEGDQQRERKDHQQRVHVPLANPSRRGRHPLGLITIAPSA